MLKLRTGKNSGVWTFLICLGLFFALDSFAENGYETNPLSIGEIDEVVRMELYSCSPLRLLVLRDSIQAAYLEDKIPTAQGDCTKVSIDNNGLIFSFFLSDARKAMQALRSCEVSSRREHNLNLRKLQDTLLARGTFRISGSSKDTGLERSVSKLIVWTAMIGGVCVSTYKSSECMNVRLWIDDSLLTSRKAGPYLVITSSGDGEIDLGRFSF